MGQSNNCNMMCFILVLLLVVINTSSGENFLNKLGKRMSNMGKGVGKVQKGGGDDDLRKVAVLLGIIFGTIHLVLIIIGEYSGINWLTLGQKGFNALLHDSFIHDPDTDKHSPWKKLSSNFWWGIGNMFIFSFFLQMVMASSLVPGIARGVVGFLSVTGVIWTLLAAVFAMFRSAIEKDNTGAVKFEGGLGSNCWGPVWIPTCLGPNVDGKPEVINITNRSEAIKCAGNGNIQVTAQHCGANTHAVGLLSFLMYSSVSVYNKISKTMLKTEKAATDELGLNRVCATIGKSQKDADSSDNWWKERYKVTKLEDEASRNRAYYALDSAETMAEIQKLIKEYAVTLRKDKYTKVGDIRDSVPFLPCSKVGGEFDVSSIMTKKEAENKAIKKMADNMSNFKNLYLAALTALENGRYLVYYDKLQAITQLSNWKGVAAAEAKTRDKGKGKVHDIEELIKKATIMLDNNKKICANKNNIATICGQKKDNNNKDGCNTTGYCKWDAKGNKCKALVEKGKGCSSGSKQGQKGADACSATYCDYKGL